MAQGNEKFNQILVDSPKAYKRCEKKKYDVYLCKPPLCTFVIDKLRYPELVKQLNGNTYYTSEQFNSGNYSERLFEMLRDYKCGLNALVQYVICGTRGELYPVSIKDIVNSFTFATGSPITPQTILQHSYTGVRGEIHVSARSTTTCMTAIKEAGNNESKLKQITKDAVMPWVKITSKTVGLIPEYALFVPKAYKFQIQTSRGVEICNNPAIRDHGLGDFIVCRAGQNGMPDLTTRRVVNGLVFKDTYNNVGWTDCVDGRVNAENHVVMPSYELCSVVENEFSHGRNLEYAYKAMCLLVQNIKDRFKDNACRVYEQECVNYTNQQTCHIKVGGDNDDILRLVFRLVPTEKAVSINVTGQSNHEKLDATWDFTPILRCTNLSKLSNFLAYGEGVPADESGVDDKAAMEYYNLSQKIWVRCRNVLHLSPWRLYEEANKILKRDFNEILNRAAVVELKKYTSVARQYSTASGSDGNTIELSSLSIKERSTKEQYNALYTVYLDKNKTLSYGAEVQSVTGKPDVLNFRLFINSLDSRKVLLEDVLYIANKGTSYCNFLKIVFAPIFNINGASSFISHLYCIYVSRRDNTAINDCAGYLEGVLKLALSSYVTSRTKTGNSGLYLNLLSPASATEMFENVFRRLDDYLYYTSKLFFHICKVHVDSLASITYFSAMWADYSNKIRIDVGFSHQGIVFDCIFEYPGAVDWVASGSGSETYITIFPDVDETPSGFGRDNPAEVAFNGIPATTTIVAELGCALQ